MLRLVDIAAFFESIRQEEYLPQVTPLRNYYPVLMSKNPLSRPLAEAAEEQLPQVCFTSELQKKHGRLLLKQFNSLLVLVVDNLPGTKEAAALRQVAALIPYTRMAYVSASGRGLVIVCKVGWAEGTAPDTQDEMQHYLLQAYTRLHYLYSAQLGLTLDNIQPDLAQFFFVSADRGAYFNPDSEPYYVSREQPLPPVQPLPERVGEDTRLLPGYTSLQTQYEVFEWCLSEAMQKAGKEADVKEEVYLNALSLLAVYCADSGLPMDFAIRRLRWKPHFDMPQTLVERTFQNAYDEHTAPAAPFAHVSKNALLVYRTEAFLRTHYELRRNVMTGIVQYRPRGGYQFGYHDVTESVMNTMTNRALKAGIDSWDKDVRRILDSDEVPAYEPLSDYLYQLPKWDGTDRVAELAGRIPTDFNDAERYLHVWLLSTVAHWLGKSDGHGNALVPLLIGGQGCGKTSFAAILLPPELREYYNDKVDFRNETALMLGLTSFALINIDEFDALKRSQQPVLKYLLSKSDVKMRPPYGKAYVNRRRFASFIATTNHLHPLTDPTGSRRFVCIRIVPGGMIDFLSPIDYDQLYAQLLSELNDGARYWLDEDETRELMEHNSQYQQLADVGQMIDRLYRRPEPNEGQKGLSIAQIATVLVQNYPNLRPTRALNIEIGRILTQKGYESKRTNSSTVYYVVER